MSILGSATNWLVKTGLEAAFGGGSKGGGGSGVSQAISQSNKQTQQRLASIEGRQVMSEFGRKQRDIQSAGMSASAPPDTAARSQKSQLGMQLIHRAKQNAVADPLMMQLVTRQAERQGNITDDVVASIQGSYKSSALDTATRTRKTARASFLKA
tara:strand:+ start:47 stop:511 length:465 start_codon:yes stop_codon:yes gene_type:complete